MPLNHALKDLTGLRFGYLVVERRAGSTPPRGRRRKKSRYATWHCVCDCGQKVICVGHLLRAGKRKACARNGHYWQQRTTEGLVAKYPSEYRSFCKMHERCRNKRHHRYAAYGGRGIKVCERWKVFKFFIADMGCKPAPEYTIDRIDGTGNYEPTNCRWATRKEQSRNMRNNVYVEYEGQRMLLMDVVAKLALNRSVVSGRLRNGWSLEEALTIPVKRIATPPYKKIAP